MSLRHIVLRDFVIVRALDLDLSTGFNCFCLSKIKNIFNRTFADTHMKHILKNLCRSLE